MNQNQKIIEKIIKDDPFNYKCADCDTKCPRWCSVNLGVFICQTCAGIHRGLGTHISYVKSINLDEWTNDMIENIKKNGNEKVNKKYEANLTIKKPEPTSEIDEKKNFIERKYRDKRFYKEVNIKEANIIEDKKESKIIDLLNFENEKKDNIQNLEELFNFSNNISFFDKNNTFDKTNDIDNKINEINKLYDNEIYKQQLYQQQLYQQQLYQQQLYQQQLYQQQLYQKYFNNTK